MLRGAPTTTKGRAIKRRSPCLPVGGSAWLTASTRETTAEPGSEVLFTAYNIYPSLLLTASSSLGSAELPASQRQTVG